MRKSKKTTARRLLTILIPLILLAFALVALNIDKIRGYFPSVTTVSENHVDPRRHVLPNGRVDPYNPPDPAESVGKAFVEVNGGEPVFSKEELSAAPAEKYSPLDASGRCGPAYAVCCIETMPKEGEDRGSISKVKPSGWVQKKYPGIDGGYLYNRCHLIGWQLTSENANKRNLVTGTRYMNTEGMLPFENMIADYIRETKGHVAYRVTPVFSGRDLVCRGIQLEAFSEEDNGEAICFNVYCFNIQPGIRIDYGTGDSEAETK